MISRAKLHRFVLAVAALAVTWLVILPWLGRQSPLREMIGRNERAGIDASALYYSDLEHLRYRDGILRRRMDR